MSGDVVFIGQWPSARQIKQITNLNILFLVWLVTVNGFW